MKTNTITKPTTNTPAAEHPALAHVEPLALRPKQAAKALGIGERLLWSWTNQGRIPHMKIGKAILYPVRELRAWLSEQAKGGDRP